MTPLFEGSRVELRCVEQWDVPEIVVMLNDWEVAQWLSVPPYPYTEENGRRFCEMVKANHALACPTLFAVALRADNRIIGSIEVQADAVQGFGVGYWIGRQHWQKGYAGEALALIERHAVERLAARRLFAVLDADNLASRKLLESAKFVQEATVDLTQPTRRGRNQLVRCGKSVS